MWRIPSTKHYYLRANEPVLPISAFLYFRASLQIPPYIKMEEIPRMRYFNDIQTLNHRMFAINGMDMLKYENFKRQFRYNFNVCQASIFCVCYGYSWYQFSRNTLELIFSSCVAGIAAQGVSVMFLFITRGQEFRRLFFQAKEFYDEICEDSGEELIKDSYCKFMKRLCYGFFTGFLVLVLLNILYPVVGRLFFGQYTLLFGLDVPLLNETTSPDYEIVFLYQVVQDLYTLTNLCTFQNFFIVMVLHNICLMDVLVHRMKGPWALGSPRNWQRLRNIIVLHQKQQQFFRDLTDLFDLYNTLQIIFTTLVSTMIAFILIFEIWIPGYVLIILSLGMLFNNCVYGTYIERKAEEMADATFHWLDWTVLTPRQRRVVILVMRLAQSSTQLRCGGIFVVNFHTFLSVRWAQLPPPPYQINHFPYRC